MSDKDKGDEEEAPAPAKQGFSKVALLFGLLNLGLTGFVAYGLMQVQAVQAAGVPEPEKVIVTVPDNGPTVDLDPFVVNLNEPGTNRYLKSKVSVEVRDEEAVAELKKIKAKVRDDLLRYLSGLTLAETMGAESKVEIRSQLLARLHDRLGNEKVRDIYFSEFVVQ